MIKAVLLDLAGVLYDGAQPIPGAVDAVAHLQQSALATRYVTNTSRRSPTQVYENLLRMGFRISAEDLYTAPGAVTAYLQDRHSSCYPLVHENLDELFAPFAAAAADAVVVADAGERFDYAHLNQAFEHLMNGAELISIGDNRYFREQDRWMLDAGPFIHALSYAAGVEPIVIGKPSTAFFRIVLDSADCTPDEALMIGDDVVADVEGALRAGLHACLVKTGKYRAGDEHRCGLPGARVAGDLSEALSDLSV